MPNALANDSGALLVRIGSRCCAFPLEDVVETLRPLPIEPVDNMPPGILGLATIRGLMVPIVDLAFLFGGQRNPCPSRFVLLRLDERRAAVAVDEVFRVSRLDNQALQTFPPLLRGALADAVTAIELRDERLLFVLAAARLIPEDAWKKLESSEVMS